MSLQDLTPQLRTRLSRLERVVGLFVAVATLLLLAGLAFYVYQLAKQKGWFLPKLSYFTFVRSAGGLKVGQPVRLMGLEVGEITRIDPEQPGAYYDMFVAFEVKKPYYGYLWDDSRARVGTSDFLGNRFIELTKGTNGPPTYLFRQFREVTLAEAEEAINSTNAVLIVDEIYDDTKTNILAKPKDVVTRELLARLAQAGSVATLRIIDTPYETERPTGIWDFRVGRYKTPNSDEETRKGYFLPPEESPAIGDRLEAMMNTVETALPGILNLTNDIQKILEVAGRATTHADELLIQLQPAVTNLTLIAGNLTDPKGSLGEWLLPTNLSRQLSATLGNANTIVTNSDARLTEVAVGLDSILENLAGITSNLHSQVNANTNMLRELSTLIVDADQMLQGLKQHWLLRSAFKKKKEDNRKPSRSTPGRARSPKDIGRD